MKKIAAMALVLVMAAATGCTLIRAGGISEDMDPALKRLVMHRVQKELVRQGLTVSDKELSTWYDEVVKSAEIQALAEQIGQNVSIRGKAEELIKEYYPAIAKAAAK